MAVTKTLSNHFKDQLVKGNIDMDGDTFKVILMNTTFAFDPATHDTLSDVTADQIATGNGYTQDDKTLANVTVTRDDVGDKVTVTWDDPTWTATADSIGPQGAAIIYDDTTADDTVLGCIDYGTDYTTGQDASFQLQDVGFEI